MGRKIFVSYKYADNSVNNLSAFENSTVRSYVDLFEKKLQDSDNIYKGEPDGEDLSHLNDNQIWELLKSRIFDSSVTLVFISPKMRETWNSDRNQWIPWEISFSLKETARKNKKGEPVTSHTNAMIAVVLPDSTGSYSYYLENKTCCKKGCLCHHTDILFAIIQNNMFNIINPDNYKCDSGDTIWRGSCSYIAAVKWCDFISDYRRFIEQACIRQKNLDSYKITKDV